jgi:hypothetical protein
MTEELRQEYAYQRAHQAKAAVDGCYGLTVYPSGRTEVSYGSAPYGEHALSAFSAAKQMVSFLRRYRKSQTS